MQIGPGEERHEVRRKRPKASDKMGRYMGFFMMRIALLVSLLCLSLPLGAQEVIRLSGSTSVRGLLEPRQTELQARAGCKLEFSGAGSAGGLLALVAGTADAAMLSLPLEDAVAAVNQKTPGRVDPAQLVATQIGEIRILFVVNPRNPVRSLTSAQLADVLSGKVANWKEVGGPDTPILVVSLGNGGSLLGKLLGGKAITAGARVMSNATQIAVVVAEQPNAIGIVSSGHPRGQTTVLRTDAAVNTPLLLVTRGQPGPTLQKLETAARSLLASEK